MGYIYKITNMVNGKAYIGKSVYEPEDGRIKQHLSGQTNQCPAIYNAVKKYGKDAFISEILYQGIIPELLSDFEIQAIKEHNTISPNGYNLTHGGDGMIPSEETRRKMSKNRKGIFPSEESRRKMSEAQRRRKFKPPSEETRRKISERKKGIIFTAEHRQKISLANKGNIPPNRKTCYLDARNMFFSLPNSFTLKEKREKLFQTFPNIKRNTIYAWVIKWNNLTV